VTGVAATTSPTARVADRLGLRSDWDFLLHLPLRYEDETRITPVADVRPGDDVQVEGEVVRCDVIRRAGRQLVATLRDAAGDLVQLRYLHFYPSQASQLAVGRRVRVFGTARAPSGSGAYGVELVHPRVRAADGETLPQSLTPVYPTVEGVSQAWLRKRIDRALRDVDIVDPLPPELIAHLRLPPLAYAVKTLHQPPPEADLAQLAGRTHPAWQRLKFDELLAQQLSLRTARAQRAARRAPALLPQGSLVDRLLRALPFALTRAQQRVWHDVSADLRAGQPMHRLVQGDVGSGKTVVAALASAQAIDAGWQAALMAPTEILGEQHFRRIVDWLAPLGVDVTWLTGRMKAAEKRAAQARIGAGDAQLVVGTHALIQDKVEFARLGLAVVDEQHRFGVAQRLKLRGAGPVPHLLMLSATPIPRTLAMSYFADLDVSVIDEMPPGRQPIVTKLVSTRRRDEVLERVRAESAAGRQTYWICPLVDESDKLDAAYEVTAATRMYEQTRAQLADVRPLLRLGLVHGQLPAHEKNEVMRAFAAGAIDVLIATTVVEVGVDVPNATLMVIEHAQRFGLAQLHQLRGRVGRGAAQSYCVLLFDEPLAPAARERLKIIYEHTDGFEIARRDLQLRGPGELLGARQSGVPMLRFADLERDTDLLDAARDVATRLLARHPEAAGALLKRWFAGREDFIAA
jgi:ATP-dependent DNA helicase RecG